MAGRDQYKVNIRCTACGETGYLYISEDTYPYVKTPNREIEEIVGNFHARLRSDVDIDITCNSCGNAFSYL